MAEVYILKKQLLEFKPGTPVTVEGETGTLGRLPWGWQFPKWLILRETEWFEKVTK